MRANEFITERQRVDEVVPLVLGGLTVAGLGLQAYDTYKDIEAYRKGEITKQELINRGVTDAAIAALGGVAGKTIQKGWQFSKAGLNLLKGGKKGTDAATDATKLAKPGSTIQTPKGPRVAGVDGKPTVIDPTKRGARADIKKIKQAAKKQQDAVKPGAATASAATKKADDLAKKKPDAVKPGAATASMGSKIAKSPITRGVGLAALANQTTDYIADFLKGVQDIKDREARGDYGQKKYLYKGKKDIGQDKVVKIGAQNPDPNRVIPGKS